MVEKFPDLGEQRNTQLQETVPNEINPKTFTKMRIIRNIIIKMSKVIIENLKSNREAFKEKNNLYIQGNLLRLSAYVSAEALQARGGMMYLKY